LIWWRVRFSFLAFSFVGPGRLTPNLASDLIVRSVREFTEESRFEP
jgi:hypothetical protein